MARKMSQRVAVDQIIDEREQQEARERKHYSRAISEWVADHSWNHFVTLTTERPDTKNNPVSKFTMWAYVMRFIRAVGRSGGVRPGWFAVLELQADGAFHAHVLLDRTDHMTTHGVQRNWPSSIGISEVEIYDRTKNGPAYIADRLRADADDMWRICRRGLRRAVRHDGERFLREATRRWRDGE